MEKLIKSFELPEANKVFAEKIESLVDWFSWLIDGEISYAQVDKNWWRRAISFFGEWEGIIEINDIDSFLDKVNNRLDDVNELSRFVAENFTWAQAALFQKSLVEYKDKFEMFTHAVWFEAQKWWYELPRDEFDYHLTCLQEGMKKIRGEPILSSKKRVQWVYDDVYTAYNLNQSKLSSEDLLVIDNFLLKLQKDHRLNPHQAIESATKKALNHLHPNIFENQIDATTQAKLFGEYLKKEQEINSSAWAFWWEKWRAAMKPNGKNLSVSQQLEQLNTPSVWFRPLDDSIEKIWHENKHVNSAKNSNEFFGLWFKWPKYLGTEEWRATLDQEVTKWNLQSLSDLDTLYKNSDEKTRALVVCETYGFDESVALIDIFIKLWLYEIGWVKRNPAARVLRSKRMWPLHMPYASSKDRVYLDGYEEVIEYLKESLSIEEMFDKLQLLNEYKVSIADLPLMQKIKEELNIKQSYLHQSHFISRRLWRNLEGLDDNNIPKWTLDELIYQISVDISDLLNIVDAN